MQQRSTSEMDYRGTAMNKICYHCKYWSCDHCRSFKTPPDHDGCIRFEGLVKLASFFRIENCILAANLYEHRWDCAISIKSNI